MNSRRVEKEASFWNLISGRYDRMIDPMYDRLKEVCISSVPSGGSVLEIGCGTALITREIARKAGHVTGIDVSTRMLEKARSNLEASGLSNVDLIRADAYSLPFDSGSFQTVLCCNVLHIVKEPGLILHEVARVLSPGGRFIAITYLHGERTRIRSMMELQMMRLMHIIGKLPYLTRYRREELKEIFVGSGFEIMEESLIDGEEPKCQLMISRPLGG
jgi:ubiquinone/menaquinone biosynthesis C-methylase UbiE